MYGDTQPMFDKNELRRSEALSQAVMADQTGNARLIINSAEKFEKFLKEGETDGTD